jgi:hypothetical protein
MKFNIDIEANHIDVELPYRLRKVVIAPERNKNQSYVLRSAIFCIINCHIQIYIAAYSFTTNCNVLLVYQ